MEKARILGAALAVLLMAAACSSDGTGNDAGGEDGNEPLPAASTADEGEAQSVFDLAVGQCFNTSTTSNMEEVNILDCDQPHQYEVYTVVQHPAGPDEEWPGDEEINSFADAECLGDAFEDYVGTAYQESELFAFLIQPTAETWAVGDREFVCTAYLEDDELEGSVQGSNR